MTSCFTAGTGEKKRWKMIFNYFWKKQNQILGEKCLCLKSIIIVSGKIKDRLEYYFLSQLRIKEKSPLLQTLPRKTFLCICLYLCREGERANSTRKFSPAGAHGAQGDLETTSTALVVEREPVQEERTESSTLQNTQSWLDKDKCFFFFFFES